MKDYKFVVEDSKGNTCGYPKEISGDQAKKILNDLAFGGKKLHVWAKIRTYNDRDEDAKRYDAATK